MVNASSKHFGSTRPDSEQIPETIDWRISAGNGISEGASGAMYLFSKTNIYFKEKQKCLFHEAINIF